MTSTRFLPSPLVLALVGLVLAAAPAAALVGPSGDAGQIADRVVMVLQRRGSEAGFCSGVVVSPKAVLTAAHCVPPGADLRVHFRDDAGAPVLVAISSVLRHPGYRADAIARREVSVDLAVVELAEPLPARFRAATIGQAGALGVGSPFRIAGFGLTREGEAASSGRLRESTLAARAPLSKVLLWADDPQHRGAGACTGDSGGPVFDPQGEAVVALTLWAAGKGSSRCGLLTQALWLAPYRDWIRSAVAP